MSHTIINRDDKAFVALLFLTALIFPIASVYLGDAGANNLAYAMSLYEKGEPLFYRRGPLFYGMIALSFKLFGPTVEHAVWVTRFFVPVNLCLVYFIARSMFHTRAAILAAIFVFFSHAINLEAAKLELDNVMPAFMLLSLWLFWMSTKKQSLSLAIGSGLFLGLGWLVKEASMLYLPIFLLPFLFKEFRNKEQGLRSLVAMGVFLVTLSPWILYIASKGGTIADVLGAASARSTVDHLKLSMPYSTYVFNHFILNAPLNLFNYFKNYVVQNLPLWLPILMALIYSLWQALKHRSLELTFLISGILFFSPIAIYQGGIGERLGQCYVIFLLFYILLGFAMDRIITTLGNKRFVLATMVLFFIALELFNPFYSTRKSTLFTWVISEYRLKVMNWPLRLIPNGWVKSIAHAAGLSDSDQGRLFELFESSRKKGFQLGERFDEGVLEAANWIQQNVPENGLIYTSSFLTESLPFYTRFQFQFIPFEKDNMVLYRPIDDGPEKFAPFREDKLLGLISYHGFQNEDISRYRCIYLAFEKPFIMTLNNRPATFLALYKAGPTKKRYTNLFLEYFSLQQNLKLVFDNDRTRIYKINGPFSPMGKNSSFFYFNNEFQTDMAWLKDRFPDSYKKLVGDLSTVCNMEDTQKCPINMSP